MGTQEARDVVTGPRVHIRPFTREDVDGWQDWPDYPDPLLVGTSPRRLTREQRDRWYDDLLHRQRQVPFAVDDETGFLIGRLFLRHVQKGDSAVLGIDLHPDYLSKRYGTEALGAFLAYFFHELGFRRMLLSVAAFNERARKSYASLGFRVTGTHWDAHSGPDVTRDARYKHVHSLFRRGLLGLEALFYDMELTYDGWQSTAAARPQASGLQADR